MKINVRENLNGIPGHLSLYNTAHRMPPKLEDTARGAWLLSEFSRFRRSWERYHIADILHSGDKKNKALEAKAETAMRA